MITVLITCKVADFDLWRPKYDIAIQVTEGVRSWQVWRGQEDRNLVVIAEVYDSREVAEAAMTKPGLQEEMAADGVDLSSVRLEWLEDAGSDAR